MADHPEYVDIIGERDFHSPSFCMSSCQGRDQVACSAAAFGWTHFERPTPGMFAQAVRQAAAGLVIDVGANTGFYTLLALSVSGDVSVAAYEPLEEVRHILEANVCLSQRRRAAKVFPQAVSNRSGSRLLYVPDAGHGLVETSASLGADFKPDGAASIKVQATTLDEQHLSGPRVAVIKVDAEGHDLEVLQGGAAILRRDRPVVFLEVLLDSDTAGLTALMRECGYLDCALLDGESIVSDTVTHHPDGWNHMWTPSESVAAR